jgi:branched-chain amino acid transport system substrate-binding protein
MNNEDSKASAPIRRRKVIQAAAGAGLLQLATPFIIPVRAAETVKIGLDNPLTGTYAAVGKNELIGCQLAIEQINAKGGIVGRQAELLVEDSTSGDAGTAVQKARKLIERDKVDFLLGNVNSALALAMAQVSNEKGVLHIVPGGHTDAVTGTSCHWNVFRICNTTQMEANAVTPALIKTAGKKWYYITPDYAFGHTLQAGLEKACGKEGGTKLGADLTPLGTTDFSSYLIKAQAANPDVIIFLTQGDDMVNALKQAVQFGLDKRFHLAGAQQELEPLEGLPPEARIGTWVFEWYWNQPGVPHVAEFVDAIKKKTGRVPTARTWFGFAATWSCALGANQAKSLEAVKVAKAMQGMKLPPEVALMPDGAFFRAGQNQLIPNLYVGHAQAQGSAPDDLFKVTQVVKGLDAAGTLEESGCKMTWPS